MHVAASQPPLVVHIIYRLAVGGLENGLVNLINRMPAERYRHAIVCLKDATDFRQRIRRPDVAVYEMHKREGHDLGLFVRVYRLLRSLEPSIVHTRNLAAIECQVPAWLAGVPRRVHSEHGWDVHDPDGTNRTFQWLRRLHRPLVHRYIGLSTHIVAYLRDRIGVPERKLTHICNGVDTLRFAPAPQGRADIAGCPFTAPSDFRIGTVGRMHGVKDQLTLVRAFLRLLELHPAARERARLLLVGDGPLRTDAERLLEAGGARGLAWLPGERDDVPALLQGLDLFVLPSLAEGISNTILEAMATGLPVLATAVGGNPDLVVDGATGTLVPAGDPDAMARALLGYLTDAERLRGHGAAARQRAVSDLGLDVMADRYLAVYDGLLQRS
jgi:sugar transferase (PEP-CTERM/EpsH1 system associated)